MEIKFYNLPEPKPFDESMVKEVPNFVSYRPDFVLIEKLAKQYEHKKNLVIIGHGGSVTSFLGIYNVLKAQSTKKVFFVSTVDPDYISEVKKQNVPDETLVIAISKSGETVTQLEALMSFTEFELLIITGVAGPLAEIGAKLNSTMVIHPAIGGRFTGLTEVALLPAKLCGFNIEDVYEGGQQYLKQYSETNLAYQSASIFAQLEEAGIVEVFMPFYSHALFSFSNLIVQLCHESFSKDGKGQTYFAHESPESQHHTNQRFFGGRKNIAGWFMSSESSTSDLNIKVPPPLTDIHLKENQLGLLSNSSLFHSLTIERDATIEDAKLQNIPIVDMQIKEYTEFELGSLVAFWQMYAVYSSLLRNVNPFDQPQVESSKKISFNKRLGDKGVL